MFKPRLPSYKKFWTTIRLFFGKVLCLRGGHEHKSLKISQFNFGSDQGGDFVVYTENGSRNRSGTYKDKAGDNKVVKHYANTVESGYQAHIRYLAHTAY